MSFIFLKRQIRWSGIAISFRIFHSLLWSTQSKEVIQITFYFILKFILFFNFTILYWFCHKSTRIRHGCTCVPNPESPLPPPSPYHPSGSSQCTSPKHQVSCIEPGLATRFIHAILHVSMPFSQIFPPSPSLTVHKTVLYISVSFAVSYTGLLLPSF